jgi:hypothetical protein
MHEKTQREARQGVAGRLLLCRSALDGCHLAPSFLCAALISLLCRLCRNFSEICSRGHAGGPFNPKVFLSMSVDQTDLRLAARIDMQCACCLLDQ